MMEARVMLGRGVWEGVALVRSVVRCVCVLSAGRRGSRRNRVCLGVEVKRRDLKRSSGSNSNSNERVVVDYASSERIKQKMVFNERLKACG